MLNHWSMPTTFYNGVVDYDYDGEHDCMNAGCDDEGICRCGTISNIRIEKVDVDYLCHEIINNVCKIKNDKNESQVYFSKKPLLKYCLHRLITIRHIWEPDNWSLSISGGYYGEEVGGAYCDSIGFSENVEQLFSMKTAKERMEWVLHQEYGHIIDSLRGRNYKEVSVPVKSLTVPNETYFKKLNHQMKMRGEIEANQQYEESDLPIGLYLREGGTYRLVDGYHRYIRFINQNPTRRKVNIVVAG